MRRLFDPQRVERSEAPGHVQRRGDAPLLVGVEHEGSGVASAFTKHRGTTKITVLIGGAYFQFESSKPLAHRSLREVAYFFVVVCHPTNRRVVAWVAAMKDLASFRSAAPLGTQHVKGVLVRQNIFQVI